MTDKRAQIDEIIGHFDTAMLVTTSLDGKLRARPMAIADHESGGALYFATRAEDEKLQEILRSSEVALTIQGDGRYLSITGTARIETDQVLTDELWSPTMRLWFPQGCTDPQLTLVLVEPSYAEYWDRTGVRGLEFLWEAGRALLRGSKADDAGLSGHGKADLEDDRAK